MIIERTAYLHYNVSPNSTDEGGCFKVINEDMSLLGQYALLDTKQVIFEVDDSCFADTKAELAESLKEKLTELRARNHIQEQRLEATINSLLAIEHQQEK